MKSIEERAGQYALDMHPYEPFFSDWRDAYIKIATEQKAIDDAELARLKKAWEKEAEVNHDTAMAYEQGRHDAIDKACEWLNGNLGYYNRNEVHIGQSYEQCVIDDFLKAMEE